MEYNNLGELRAAAELYNDFYDMRTLELSDFEENLKRFGIKMERDLEPIRYIPIRYMSNAVDDEIGAIEAMVKELYGEKL